ncbi:UNVERIFIED_CONTAM: hypothetical protein FKN15_063576 [Acipenser sinensis]
MQQVQSSEPVLAERLQVPAGAPVSPSVKEEESRAESQPLEAAETGTEEPEGTVEELIPGDEREDSAEEMEGSSWTPHFYLRRPRKPTCQQE